MPINLLKMLIKFIKSIIAKMVYYMSNINNGDNYYTKSIDR